MKTYYFVFNKRVLLKSHYNYSLKFKPAVLMANTQRGNRRFRNIDDPSWYDRSLADNVIPRQPDLAMDIPKDKVGLIIGKKGWRLQEIKQLSGAHVVVIDNKVWLRGTPEQCEEAKKIIQEILNPVSKGGPLSEKWGIPCSKKNKKKALGEYITLWGEYLPPTNVVRVRISDSTAHVG